MKETGSPKLLFEKLDPNATYDFKKFRAAPDDFCVEEIVFKK